MQFQPRYVQNQQPNEKTYGRDRSWQVAFGLEAMYEKYNNIGPNVIEIPLRTFELSKFRRDSPWQVVTACSAQDGCLLFLV
jgi:hypothetical protein